MAEQILMSEAITKAVAEATRIATLTMAEMQAQRSESQWGPKPRWSSTETATIQLGGCRQIH